VPVRAIFEALGANVEWDAVKKTVTGIKDQTVIKLQVDNVNAVVNEEHKTMDVPAIIENNRTFVPARFISESLGAKVTWDDVGQRVIIITTGYQRSLWRPVFLDKNSAADSLAIEDNYVKSMSVFDREVRMRSESPVSVEEYKKYVRSYALDWNDSEKEKLINTIERIKVKFTGFTLNFPDEVSFIKTTGQEDANAAYCRGNTVVLPQDYVDFSDKKFEDLIIHELFHIFSKNNLEVRESLYKIIGFSKCPELILPEGFKDWIITNPDTLGNNYYIEINDGGTLVKAMPILYSTMKYDLKKGGTLFDYLNFDLLIVEVKDNKTIPVYKDNKLRWVTTGRIDYIEKVGRNTTYIIHPEEILADNFVILVNKQQIVRSPFVIEGMNKVLH
jgi:hypothetical protein